MAQVYFLYILECTNGSFYTGYTTDLVRRYKEHAVGSIKCKFTRSFPPLSIASAWSLEADKGFALTLEVYIKSLSKAQKRNLIKNPNDLAKNYATSAERELSTLATLTYCHEVMMEAMDAV